MGNSVCLDELICSNDLIAVDSDKNKKQLNQPKLDRPRCAIDTSAQGERLAVFSFSLTESLACLCAWRHLNRVDRTLTDSNRHLRS